MNPLVSIIVPAYNVENFIDRTMESLSNQTLRNIEIILINDGSTDNTPAICDCWARKDNRIRVEHQENCGVAACRNKGIRIASAPLIGFIDSDDRAEPTMFEDLYAAHKKYDSDITMCNTYVDNIAETVSTVLHKNIANGLCPKNKTLVKLMFEKKFDSYCWNKLYRKELFNDIFYPEGHWMEDHATTFKLFYKAERIAYTDKPLYHYNILHGNNFTMKSSSRKELDYFLAIKDRLKFCTETSFMNRKEKKLFRIKSAQRTLECLEALDLASEPHEYLQEKEEMKKFISDCLFLKISPKKLHNYKKRLLANKIYVHLNHLF